MPVGGRRPGVMRAFRAAAILRGCRLLSARRRVICGAVRRRRGTDRARAGRARRCGLRAIVPLLRSFRALNLPLRAWHDHRASTGLANNFREREPVLFLVILRARSSAEAGVRTAPRRQRARLESTHELDSIPREWPTPSRDGHDRLCQHSASHHRRLWGARVTLVMDTNRALRFPSRRRSSN